MRYIIGDLHANVAALRSLLVLLRLEQSDELIFLGDYIDKYSSTQETLALLFELRGKYKCRFIKGNHEYVWERFALFGEQDREDFIITYGGLDALREWTDDPETVIKKGERSLIIKWLAPFFELISCMEDYCFVDSYLVLHAGISRDQLMQNPLIFTEKNYFMRERDMDFDKKYLNTYTLIAGHTNFDIKPEVHLGYIGIDLGAAYDGFLGAFCVETRQVIRSDGMIFSLN